MVLNRKVSKLMHLKLCHVLPWRPLDQCLICCRSRRAAGNVELVVVDLDCDGAAAVGSFMDVDPIKSCVFLERCI